MCFDEHFSERKGIMKIELETFHQIIVYNNLKKAIKWKP